MISLSITVPFLVFLLVLGFTNVSIANGQQRRRNARSTKYDAASRQIEKWQASHTVQTATAEQGYPLPSLTATLGIGRHGPLLLQDLNFEDHLASYASERIPERVVHAKGAGAHGYFTVTNPDISKFTRANLFSTVGKRTPLVVRFSTVIGESGSPDSVNDLRGLAIKFKTQDGNYDLLMLNTLNFNIRDPVLFPSLIRSRKRNPSTHIHDPNSFWDFTSSRPETTLNAFFVSSDLGFPKNYRHMSAFSITAFKFTGGSDGAEPVFVKYHMLSNQGKAISTPETYVKEAGRDPDCFNRDLYNAIENGNYPSWTLYAQILTMDQIKKFKFYAFDATKIWPVKDYPLTLIGTMVLNQNPKDYFNEVEQIGFNPANLVPGIEISPDRLLHGRVFMYGATQRYRLGKNFHQLPVNRPVNTVKVHTYTRDGFASIYANGDGGPNYYPNSFNGPKPNASAQPTVYRINGGDVGRFDTGDADNYAQVDEYFRTVMDADERNRTLKFIASQLAETTAALQTRSLERNWDPVSSEFSRLLRAELAIANANKLKRSFGFGKRKRIK